MTERGIGSVEDWQSIVDQYGSRVWRTAYRLLGNDADASDCFQETFLSAYKVWQCQGVRNFGGLLSHLATIRAIDMLRKRMSGIVTSGDFGIDTTASNVAGPLKEAQGHELAGQLTRALGRLSGQEAEAFCLKYLNGMSYKEIGRELDIKSSYVGVLIHRARANLRELMGPVFDNEKSEVAK